MQAFLQLRFNEWNMDKKQAIIAITQAHLAAHGFHATGVEQLAVAANITKRTLYNHFGSKEALLLETMRHRDEEWMQAMQAYLQAALPENALLAYVDYLAHWLKQDDFYGCYFINACAEYADLQHEMHQLAAAHKKRIFDALHQRLPYISVLKRPAIDSVMTMGEGLIVTQQVSGNAAAAITATRSVAHHWTQKLLDTP